MKAIDDAPFLDLFAPDFLADPAPVITALRRQTCLARTAIGVLVLEHAKVVELLKSKFGLDMKAIYRFELQELQMMDVESDLPAASSSAEGDEEE